MKKLFYIPFVCILSLAALYAEAQEMQIVNLSIEPVYPTTLDNVKLKIRIYAVYSPCIPIGINQVRTNNLIQVQINSNPGLLAATCTTTDSIDLGQLPTGEYKLICDLRSPDPPQMHDRDSINFFVIPTTGMQIRESGAGVPMFYPNPASNEIYLNPALALSGVQVLKISNVAGRQIKELKGTEIKNPIDIRGLNEGLYFLHLIKDNGVLVEKLLKTGF